MSERTDEFGLARGWRGESSGRRLLVRNDDGYVADLNVDTNPDSSARNRRAAEEFVKLPATLAENARLREALEKYGQHLDGCNVFNPHGPIDLPHDCSCGFIGVYRDEVVAAQRGGEMPRPQT